MRRNLFTFAAAASVLIFIAVAMLWTRSHLRIDHVQWHTYVSDDGTTLIRRYWMLSSGHGGLWLVVDTHTMGPPAYAANAAGIRATYPAGKAPRWSSSSLMNQLEVPRDSWLGVVVGATDFANPIATVRQRMWRLPYWAMAVVAAAIPARWVVITMRRRARYRQINGLCVTCGYDMRGTPNQCPECGTVPARGAAAA